MEKQELDVRIFEYVVPILGIRSVMGDRKLCNHGCLQQGYEKILLVTELKWLNRCERLYFRLFCSPIYQRLKNPTAIKTDKLDDFKEFLPESTREFLYSDDSLEIRHKIKQEKAGIN